MDAQGTAASTAAGEAAAPGPGTSVLEVAMELALTPGILDRINEKFGPAAAQNAAMSTSVGGIGPLLRERVMAQAAEGLNVMAVSLLYDTVWSQAWYVWNHIYLKREAVAHYLRQVLEDTGLTLEVVLFDDTKAQVKVWKAMYGAASVYFLDCPAITDVVYPCQEDAPPGTQDPHKWADRQRLYQSWLAGRGALALAKALKFRPDFAVLSETPTLFAHPHLVRDEFQKDPHFEKTACVFNDHTPLEYAHPLWPRHTLDLVKLDPALYEPFLKSADGTSYVDLTRLLIAQCHGVFGVARKHAVVMRNMPSLREYGAKIQSITNGVSHELWQEPAFRDGASLSDEDLIAAKEKLKESLLDWLWRRACLWPVWLKQARGKALLLWTRRITSYKRLDMLHIIFNNPGLRRRFLSTDLLLVVGGRVYQRDNVSEKMVYTLVELLNKDQELGERVVFLHNYNVWEAPRLFHGADGSIMLSDDGREASATGFMKSQMNAGLVLANADGAVPEFVTFRDPDHPDPRANGFGVAYSDGQPDVASFMKALEDFNWVYRNRPERAAMMRAAMAVTPEVSVDRTAREMKTFFEGLLKKA